MHINEGNIFEAMRLVLPEHREMMERIKRQMQVYKRPNLSEDEMQEMQYNLQEALETKRKIRVTMYNPFEEHTYKGVPIRKGNKLYLAHEDQTFPLVIEEIVRLELM